MRMIAGGLLIAALLALPVPADAAGEGDLAAGFAAYERGDYAAALAEWQPLAEQGHALAQFALGFMYDSGEGVPQDHAQAAIWYRKAAEQGDAKAQNNLGNLCIALAKVCRRIMRKPQSGIVKRRNRGMPRRNSIWGSCMTMAKVCRRIIRKPQVWYRKAAEQGLAKAQHNLGGMYR